MNVKFELRKRVHVFEEARDGHRRGWRDEREDDEAAYLHLRLESHLIIKLSLFLFKVDSMFLKSQIIPHLEP